mmetsp:Transcript_13706/g.20806  ORF Transcript_13706/g.20806 Transcript_13706/m.20806 type:complete len:520 (+) Transcript_13706:146-1705(+)
MNRQHHLKKSVLLLQINSRSSSSSLLPSTSTSNGVLQLLHPAKQFSTTSAASRKKKNTPNLGKAGTDQTSSATPPNPHRQPFVTHRLRPGQPNPLYQVYKNTNSKKYKSDPLYKPPWRLNTKANVISAEDFAARPRVCFEEQFDSLHDGMIVLSWLNVKQQRDIFDAYTKLMLEQEKQFGVTSHEYVMRVVGQQFNISTMRVAAIVDAIHDEEQNRKNNPELVFDKLAEYVDAKTQEHINNVYKAYGEVNPNEFIEDPVERQDIRVGNAQGMGHVAVDDLYDIDELTKQSILREKDEAQLEIDGHIYQEDVDDNLIESKVNKECLELIQAQKEAFEKMKEEWNRGDSELENPLPHGGKVEMEDEEGNIVEKVAERRPRWKFVAQTINVREEKMAKEKVGKKKKKKKKSSSLLASEDIRNTIVEQDGVLRVATMKEVNDVAWKDVRNVQEFVFQGVKSAWLRRKEGEKGGWGHVPEEVKAAAKAKMEEENAKKEEEEQQEGEADSDSPDDSENSNDEKEK